VPFSVSASSDGIDSRFVPGKAFRRLARDDCVGNHFSGNSSMDRARIRLPLCFTAFLFLVTLSVNADQPTTDHKEDVIYGRKYGTLSRREAVNPHLLPASPYLLHETPAKPLIPVFRHDVEPLHLARRLWSLPPRG